MIPILALILGSIWLFLPAGVANMAPVFATKITGKQGAPIDGGRTWHGQRLFGAHKSWRGLIIGTIAGFLFFLAQAWLYRYPFFQEISVINYSTAPLLLGAALGFGALVGDLVKSFFKRRSNVAPGKSWIPFDQIDYVLGGLVFTLPFAPQFAFPSWQVWVTVIVVFFILHFAVNIIGWAIGIKENML
jgi:CDP-2,3-bis-(O-geranylgeranyl)-sn-glycerol synthase